MYIDWDLFDDYLVILFIVKNDLFWFLIYYAYSSLPYLVRLVAILTIFLSGTRLRFDPITIQ